ncbi:MAG: 1-deoxy-D-xylulose-5-phosphate synthase, partial [Oceanicoccus sp.]
ATVADMRFVKPLDETLIIELANTHDLLVTIEENTIAGGAGASIGEFLSAQNITLPLLHLGLPDIFVDQGKHEDMLSACGLDSISIEQTIVNRMKLMPMENRQSL